jgi:hypothetical protein
VLFVACAVTAGFGEVVCDLLGLEKGEVITDSPHYIIGIFLWALCLRLGGKLTLLDNMQAVTFISHTETLKDTLSSINPPFGTLLSLVPVELRRRLGAADLSYCENSMVSVNEVIFDLSLE